MIVEYHREVKQNSEEDVKMIRRIIQIDREKCNGCGACAETCHEGAIAMVDGKAELMRDDYCDGLGDCLPACPTGAIRFEEREAPAYDHAAVMAAKAQNAAPQPLHFSSSMWMIRLFMSFSSRFICRPGRVAAHARPLLL